MLLDFCQNSWPPCIDAGEISCGCLVTVMCETHHVVIRMLARSCCSCSRDYAMGWCSAEQLAAVHRRHDVSVPSWHPYVETKWYLMTRDNNNNNNKAASTKETKCRKLANSHVFVPVAVETAGTWNHLAVELTQELGRRITIFTDDPRETGFLFQRLSVTLQLGNAVSFHSTFTIE